MRTLKGKDVAPRTEGLGGELGFRLLGGSLGRLVLRCQERRRTQQRHLLVKRDVKASGEGPWQGWSTDCQTSCPPSAAGHQEAWKHGQEQNNREKSAFCLSLPGLFLVPPNGNTNGTAAGKKKFWKTPSAKSWAQHHRLCVKGCVCY